ncbi:unnamed protein product, partial [Cyprideis torosa]
MHTSIVRAGLVDIFEKITAEKRLSCEDGLRLLACRDLLALGVLANMVRNRKNGDDTFFIYNQHINYSNVCTNLCKFCAFGKEEGAEKAYQMTVEEVQQKVAERLDEPIREIHMVGGIHPHLPFQYYLDLLRGIKEVRPSVHIQAFTCVEIAHLADLAGQGIAATLELLKEAGLDSIPGGGAEVFSPRIRKLTCEKKISGEQWLEVAKIVHQNGLKSNATMLYGHIETAEERIEHLDALRRTQDETGGFLAFIPLAFHPKHTEMSDLAKTSGVDDLKMMAVSRLMLDNFPHIKAYWVMLGPKMAQVALSFGADDMDGTVKEEVITHMAGAETDQAIGSETLIRLIREAEHFVGRIEDGQRISDEDYRVLEERASLHDIGYLADLLRNRKHPEKVVTYVIDRNINYTNICISGCRFCAYYVQPGDSAGYVLSFSTLQEKIKETKALGGTQILLQGGLHPDLPLSYYEEMIRFIKEQNVHLHGFSPPEVQHFAKISGCSVDEVLDRLIAAGLDSIPGGGAEILSDRVRHRIAPEKCNTSQWLEVMEKAHLRGIRSTATMMFGHVEHGEERLEHLRRLRALQDRTGGFTAFIPWPFQPGNTALQRESESGKTGGHGYLKMLGLARLYLDNFDNIQASWVTQGAKIAQLSLFFGANDFGSTMIEENVVAAAGVSYRLSEREIRRLVEDAGFVAKQRLMDYRLA